jgi:hypothetical protein
MIFGPGPKSGAAMPEIGRLIGGCGVGTQAALCLANIDLRTDTEAAFRAFVLVQCGGGDGGADQ